MNDTATGQQPTDFLTASRLSQLTGFPEDDYLNRSINSVVVLPDGPAYCKGAGDKWVKVQNTTYTKAANPLKVQPGGDHYRKYKIQPIEYIHANGLSFLAGNIVKYATRYKEKGGKQDIEKIKHYCDLILEFEYKT